VEFDVVVVGGGFCGTLVAANILREAKGRFSLAIIERDSPIGRGAAYGTVDPVHLLNVPAGNMSAYPDAPDHFLHWARRREDGAGVLASSFLARRVYGEYLSALFKEEASRSDARFRLFEDEAVAVKVEGGKARVATKSGVVIGAARVVLALGNPRPDFPGFIRQTLGETDRCLSNPWPPRALEGVEPDDGVLLIGSGLTAADIVASLHRRGHRALIHVVSRHGALPLEHASGRRYPEFLGDGAWTVLALMRRLRGEVREAAKGGWDWREVLDSLRPAIPAIWRSFTVKERGRFLRHVRHYWDLHRHRVPPEIGAVLKGLRDSGRLIVHAGRVESLRVVDGFVEADVRARVSGDAEKIRVARVVNCTGPADLGRAQPPLIRDLLRQGLVRADQLGMGLDAEPDGALLNRDGSRSMVLSTLGPPLKGILWESTAVPELRAQARALSLRLVRECDGAAPSPKDGTQGA
jgi:uncharacterized NAD(P)/FAD-binding protein YdhS